MKRKSIAVLTVCLLLLMFLALPVAAANEAGSTDTSNTDTYADPAAGGDGTDNTATNTTTEIKGGLIALTFDDGPSQYTPKLLDAMKKRNIKVTFFIIGERVEEFSDTLKREYKEGHEIGNHTYDHLNMAKTDAATFNASLEKTKQLINTAIGADIGNQIVRPPYGSISDSVKGDIAAPLILWSVDTKDWRTRDAEAVKTQILNHAEDGAIILMHDLYETSIDGCIAAVDELKKEGYTFVTVSELFRRKGQTIENGVAYTNAEANGIDLGPLKEETKKTTEDKTKENEKEREDKGFPWGWLIFCSAILLVYGAGLYRVLVKGAAPTQRKEKSHEKTAHSAYPDDDASRRSDRDASVRRRNRDFRRR